MTYEVIVAQSAKNAIQQYINYIGVDQQSPIAAANMLARIETAEHRLSEFPHRCPIASDGKHCSFEVWALVVNSVLLPFNINDENSRVNIVGFRHGRQRSIDKF